MKACIVGGGVIGGGWVARFLLNGWDVAVFDPDPEAEQRNLNNQSKKEESVKYPKTESNAVEGSVLEKSSD